MSKSLAPEYFSKLYAENPDPWNFATSEYEAGKYRHTIKTLPRQEYQQALEIGCSIGVLTTYLASRCERLLSIDVSEEALRQARERCATLRNVEFEQMTVPRDYPSGAFDLTVVSEVGYYLGWDDLAKLALRIQKHTVAHGQLLLVHWLPFVNDYPLTGDQVHEYFLSLPDWQCVYGVRADRYRIELLELRD